MTSQDAALSMKERVARLYNQKVTQLARASVEREGQRYGTSPVDLKQLAAMWDEPKPGLSEPDAWEQVLGEIAQQKLTDPGFDEDEAIAEAPVQVGQLLYPKRVEVLKIMGGLTYEDWARDADLVEAQAKKLRKERSPDDPLVAGLPRHHEPPPEPPAPAPGPSPDLPPSLPPTPVGVPPPPARPAPMPMPVQPPLAAPGATPGVPMLPPAGAPLGVTSGPAPGPMMTPGGPGVLPVRR
jgi:hypothetical protein